MRMKREETRLMVSKREGKGQQMKEEDKRDEKISIEEVRDIARLTERERDGGGGGGGGRHCWDRGKSMKRERD